MTRYQQAMESMLYDLLFAQSFSLHNLEEMMKNQFPVDTAWSWTHMIFRTSVA